MLIEFRTRNPDGGYPSDMRRIPMTSQMGSVNFANHIIRENNCINWNTKNYWLSNFVVIHIHDVTDIHRPNYGFPRLNDVVISPMNIRTIVRIWYQTYPISVYTIFLQVFRLIVNIKTFLSILALYLNLFPFHIWRLVAYRLKKTSHFLNFCLSHSTSGQIFFLMRIKLFSNHSLLVPWFSIVLF